MKQKQQSVMDKKRIEIIARCEGNSILDIGSVATQLESLKRNIENNLWLHAELAKRFNKVVGIDILKKEIQELRRMGYDVRYGNAEDFELNEKFDTIVAGELIEHLSMCVRLSNPPIHQPLSFDIRITSLAEVNAV